MKTSVWSAVKSDKDSSFVLLTVSDRRAELLRLLEDQEHFELVAESPQELFQLDSRVLAAYKQAVTALVDFPRPIVALHILTLCVDSVSTPFRLAGAYGGGS